MTYTYMAGLVSRIWRWPFYFL